MKSFNLITIVLILILSAGIGFSQKQQPPEGSQPRDFILPVKETFTLDNGLKVTLVQYGNVPKINVRFVIRGGNVNESESEVWLADLTADYLKEGTRTRSAREIAESAAQIGGWVNAASGLDQISVSGEALAEYAPDLVTLMTDVLMNPGFPDTELDRLKNNMLRNLQVQKSQPQSLAQEQFHKVIYADHPYGRIFPTEAMIMSYSVDQVKKFYQSNFGAGRTHLYVAGIFDVEKVKSTIRKNLNSWIQGEPFNGVLPKPVSERMIHMVNRAGSAQSTIILGLPVIDPTSSDYIPLIVTDAILGGSFASRITSNIRENKGYTYSPFSQISVHFRDAYWAENASVGVDVTGASLKEIFYEIDRMQKEPPSDQELKGIQNYLAGIFVLQNSSRNGIIGQLSFMDLHGLEDSYLSSYVKKVYQVTPVEVQQMTKTYLLPDKMTIVIVGDTQKVKSQVGSYGKIVM
jgi:zinc protease